MLNIIILCILFYTEQKCTKYYKSCATCFDFNLAKNISSTYCDNILLKAQDSEGTLKGTLYLDILYYLTCHFFNFYSQFRIYNENKRLNHNLQIDLFPALLRTPPQYR